ncbi:unnamed protein product [Alternaria alternata]
MGLAPLLVDTYRKYKKGTNNFVQWLAETARATGTVNDVFKNSCQDVVPPTGGRLKGAARKEAKKARLTHDATATCQITTKSFVTLATAISADKRASVPPAVHTTLRAVIRGRKDCANWYAMSSNAEDDTVKENDARHKHFIKILETVLEILRAKQPRAQHQPLKTKTPAPIPTKNTYDLLEAEELSESEDMPDMIESPARPTKVKVIYKLELSDADVSFAIYCFLKDATHLRLTVRRTWREFAKGDIGLQAAALTMNAAVAMIEKLSNEFEEAHPRFKDSENQKMHITLINFVYKGYRKEQQGPAFIGADVEDSDPFAYQEGKQKLHSSTVLCTHTTDLLLTIFAKGNKAEEYRLSNDEKRLLKCVSQFASAPDIQNVTNSYIVCKAASALLRQRRMNSWIIFSLQIFWDMQRELGSHISVGRMVFDKTAQNLSADYQAYLDVKGLQNVGVTHRIHRDGIILRKELVDFLINEPEFQDLFDQCEQVNPWTFSKLPGFSLLRYDPGLCGLLLANIRDEYHRATTDFASNQSQILVAAHLYNAAKCVKLIPHNLQWTDMDWFIEQQGIEWIFVGKKPKQGIEFAKQMNIALGYPAHTYAKDYRPRKGGDGTQSVVGRARRHEYHARYSVMSYDKEPHFKKVICESKAKNDILIMLEAMVKDYRDKHSSVQDHISSLEKLRIFKLAIEKDEPAFAFDMMDMYLRCIRMLQAIQTYAFTHAPLDYPKSKFAEGLSMNRVATDMLHDLSGEPRHHPTIFPEAAAIVRKIIQEEGDAVSKKAKIRTEGMLEDLHTRAVGSDKESFENPPEDTMSLEWRERFSMIAFADDMNNVRMPFGAK